MQSSWKHQPFTHKTFLLGLKLWFFFVDDFTCNTWLLLFKLSAILRTTSVTLSLNITLQFDSVCLSVFLSACCYTSSSATSCFPPLSPPPASKISSSPLFLFNESFLRRCSPVSYFWSASLTWDRPNSLPQRARIKKKKKRRRKIRPENKQR